ncbi:blue-sensitive opsin-like [Ptychodera flava]|uniref:blue-sensitive opsin-like n=1 Tax=Ptychodera flava TaxID=63121 RepID=UPI003969DDDA
MMCILTKRVFILYLLTWGALFGEFKLTVADPPSLATLGEYHDSGNDIATRTDRPLQRDSEINAKHTTRISPVSSTVRFEPSGCRQVGRCTISNGYVTNRTDVTSRGSGSTAISDDQLELNNRANTREWTIQSNQTQERFNATQSSRKHNCTQPERSRTEQRRSNNETKSCESLNDSGDRTRQARERNPALEPTLIFIFAVNVFGLVLNVLFVTLNRFVSQLRKKSCTLTITLGMITIMYCSFQLVNFLCTFIDHNSIVRKSLGVVLQSGCVAAASLTILGLAVERYVAICRPMFYNTIDFPFAKVYAYVATTLCAAVTITYVCVDLLHMTSDGIRLPKAPLLQSDWGIVLFVCRAISISSMLFPVVFVIPLYILIARKIWQSRRAFAEQSTAAQSNKHHAVTLTCFLISLTMFVMLAPEVLLSIYRLYNHTQEAKDELTLHSGFQYFLIYNKVCGMNINGFIYSLGSSEYRSYMLNLFCCRRNVKSKKK